MKKGLTAIYSSMNSGKTTLALQTRYNCLEIGMEVAIFTAAIDNRAGVGVVASRLGISCEAMTFDKDTDFFEVIKGMPKVRCVIVDEAQFVAPLGALALHRAATLLDLPVICFMLRTDFMGVPFPGAAALLSYADEIQEVKAICRCENKSTMNIRLDDNGERVRQGDQILIGGNNRYRQVCAHCFYT